jgi:hypothetical protein
MDGMMINYGMYDISILVEALTDNTGQVQAGTRDMLISAISEMTRRSHAIRLVAFGSDSSTLASFLQLSGKKSAYNVVPKYDIRGSVSQMDKNMVKANTGSGLKLGGIGLGQDESASASVLALDLAIMKASDFSVIPGVVSKNTIIISDEASAVNAGASTNVGASIGKLGVKFDMSLRRAEGTAQAVRNLIELATVELIGKLTKTPYWQCLGVAPQNPEIQREIGDWFYTLAADRLAVPYFQEQLINRRFYVGAVDGKFTPQFAQAIKLYQQGLGVEANGEITEAFYAAFLNQPTPTPPKKPVAAVQQRTELNIRYVGAPKTTLQPGEEFQLEIVPSRATHITCYFNSEDGNIQRFYPNRFSTNAVVTPQAPLKLPGTMPFKLSASSQGKTERLVCFTSPKPIINELPANIRGVDFENLSVQNLGEVEKVFKSIVGDNLGGKLFEIKVK